MRLSTFLCALAGTGSLVSAACTVNSADTEPSVDAGDPLAALVPGYSATWLATPPTIDGSLGEYASLPAITLTGASGSAVVRAGWDASALYVAYDVTDGTLLPATGAESNLWDGDGVELMIDAARERSSTADQNDYHLIITSSGLLSDSRAWTDYAYSSNATVRVVPRTGGYRIELKVPFASLGITPAGGKELGFDVAFNDRDVAGGTLTSKDYAGLTAFNAPASWAGFALAAPPPAVPSYTASWLAASPAIDGTLDEYAGLAATTITGPSGSAVVVAGWNAEALYVAYDVTDGTLLPATGAESNLWDGDGVELMIDAANDRSSTADQNDVHLIITPSGLVADSRAWTDYGYSANATVRAVTRSGGYRVELKLPFASLGITPAAGQQLGFDVAFNDRDVAGGTLTSRDFAGLTAFNAPAKWGVLALGASPMDPPPMDPPPMDPPPMDPPPSCPAGNTGPGTAPNGTVPGTPSFPHPTLRNATILWPITGDANANGVVSVRYRVQGATAWKRGMDLRRAPAGTLEGFSWTDRHAGSLFDLQPATTYEVELFLLDPDGGCLLRTGTFTTRAIPTPMAGAPVKAATPSTLSSVLSAALPGDIIELAAGTYAGFTPTKDGTAAKPIVIRAKAGATVTVSGDVVVSGRKYVHLVGLTVNGRIRLNSSAGMAIMNNVINAGGTTGNGIDAALRSEDNYIADNRVNGPTTWIEASLGYQGANLGEGIRVNGPGHVVEHNKVTGFRDCLSTQEPGEGGADQYSLDFIENDLGVCTDDGIEADSCVHNCRVIRNRFTNVFQMASSQPGFGGPTYFIRNVGYNVVGVPFKLHNGTIGDVILHNTVVKNGDAFAVYASVTFARQYARNNLFLGGPGGTYNGYTTGTGRAIYMPYAATSGDYDYDGLGSTTGTFTGKLGAVTFTSLAALRSTTTEKHAIQVDLGVFATTVAYPSAPFPARGLADLRLRTGANAIDAGFSIPNVNDSHAGSGPDLGAYELGAPLPVYGPR